QAELAQGVADVLVDGVGRQEQLVGDLLVGAAQCRQLGDLLLPRGQPVAVAASPTAVAVGDRHPVLAGEAAGTVQVPGGAQPLVGGDRVHQDRDSGRVLYLEQ